MNPTSQQLARALILRGCGISDEVVEVQPENTPNLLLLQDKQAAGIFDDLHRMEVERLTLALAIRDGLLRDYATEHWDLRTSRQCWRLLALLLGGLLFCALRWPGCGR